MLQVSGCVCGDVCVDRVRGQADCERSVCSALDPEACLVQGVVRPGHRYPGVGALQEGHCCHVGRGCWRQVHASHVRECGVDGLRGEAGCAGVADRVISEYPVVVRLVRIADRVAVCRHVRPNGKGRKCPREGIIGSPLDGKACLV